MVNVRSHHNTPFPSPLTLVILECSRLLTGKQTNVFHTQGLSRVVKDNFLPDEHSQSISHHLLCTRMTPSRFPVALTQDFLQSGHSLHEHSYKIDADLSEIGWEYAAQLKDFVLERRAKSLKERGLDPRTSRLVVRASGIMLNSTAHSYFRYGPPLVAVRTTPRGRSWRLLIQSSQVGPNAK